MVCRCPWSRDLRREFAACRLLGCWDCGFESCRGHASLSLVSVVCCQLEVSESGWSLVRRSPTECSECV